MREAIQSALAQTYPNIEVIVVNDGSKDNGETDRIARSYGSRIRYYSKENGGVATAINYGIEQMEGEYYSWLSHDDLYSVDKIEKQMEMIGRLPKDTIVFSGYELINEKAEKIGDVSPHTIYPIEKLELSLFAILRGLINGNTLLIHKSHFNRVGLFDPRLKSTQDYDLWFKMFRGSRIAYIPGNYVKSRVHDQQGTHTISQHEEECSNLWINMIDGLTADEMIEMEGSKITFYKKTEEFLRANTNYNKAITHAKKLYLQEEGAMSEGIKKVKVSVIIPFYNRIPLLIESVMSVIHQTHKNLEIILVNDGSTENLSRLFEVMSTDNRIKYFEQPNKGASSARNLGLQESTGEYIAFLDSDDLFKPDKIELQLKYMLKNCVDFSHTSYRRMDYSGAKLEVVESGLFSGIIYPEIIYMCTIAMPTVMVSKAIVRKCKFNENYHIGEDVCFWIDLASSHKLQGLNKPLTLVRISEESAAFNIHKQREGLATIASHVIKHPLHSRFEAEIQQLLNALNIAYGNSVITIGNGTFSSSPRSRVSRLLISLGQQGVATTYKKIIYKLKLVTKRKFNLIP
jgi:hypothetical protein